ncbi:MAG: 30S ribosomal protein S6 [Candidatus Pacebacteria bacterium]|nr:30S ribosomal protein S6 [Candidatus Paceibacterota bacterium]
MNKDKETQDNDFEPRVYEVSYLIVPSVAQEKLSEKAVAIRGVIESAGGKVIVEGEPKHLDLAYEMSKVIANKRTLYKTGYFGWIKFESDPAATEKMHAALEKDSELIRFMLIKTVKDDTLTPIEDILSAEVEDKARLTREKEEVKKKTVIKKEESAPISKEEIDEKIDKLIVD